MMQDLISLEPGNGSWCSDVRAELRFLKVRWTASRKIKCLFTFSSAINDNSVLTYYLSQLVARQPGPDVFAILVSDAMASTASLLFSSSFFKSQNFWVERSLAGLSKNVVLVIDDFEI